MYSYESTARNTKSVCSNIGAAAGHFLQNSAMSMITFLRKKAFEEKGILVTVQAGTDLEKLSFRVEKSALVARIGYTVKLNMKCFEHVYCSDIYFYDPLSCEVVGNETPLVFYHGKVLIARLKPSLYEGVLFNMSYC